MIGDVELKPSEVHVWIAQTTDWALPDDRTFLASVLSQSERDRTERFAFDKDRDVFVLSHAMLRHALSACAPRMPRTWQFSQSSYGKPELIRDPDDLPLQFNLTHTPGLAACAVALGCEVGIDVENVERNANEDDLAAHSFSPREQEYLRRLPVEKRRRAFFDIWTLKEAYIKARGMGLFLALESFSIVLEENRPPRIQVRDDTGVAANHCQFFQWPIEPYVVSLAVRTEAAVTAFLHWFRPDN